MMDTFIYQGVEPLFAITTSAGQCIHTTQNDLIEDILRGDGQSSSQSSLVINA